MKTDGEIARAVALRAKHALLNADNKRRIMKMPLDLLCISTFNRQGCYPSPRRVQGLMCDLLLKGFSVAEANHEGVVVQELPQDQWQAYERKFSKPYQSFREFNTTNTASVKALEMAFSSHNGFQHGTLSHSHLVLGLLCLKNGACWELFPEHKNRGLEGLQTGKGGRGTNQH